MNKCAHIFELLKAHSSTCRDLRCIKCGYVETFQMVVKR